MEHGLPRFLPHGWALFSGFGGLCFANWGKIGTTLKRHISVWPNETKGVLTNWCWNDVITDIIQGGWGALKNRIKGPVIILPNQRQESSSHNKRNHRRHTRKQNITALIKIKFILLWLFYPTNSFCDCNHSLKIASMGKWSYLQTKGTSPQVITNAIIVDISRRLHWKTEHCSID